MLYGIIDLGSNTIRLSIFTYEQGEAKLLLNKKVMAGLVSYVDDQKLSSAGIAKACAVLNTFKELLTNFNIKIYHVFATACLRNIANTDEATKAITDGTGLHVDVLTGEEEARFGFLGALRVIDSEDGLLIDIGGASTELLIFKKKEIVQAASMPIGSLNLYLKYIADFQPTKKELAEIKNGVLYEIEKTGISGTVRDLFAVGGTAKTACKLYDDFYDLPTSNVIMETPKFEALLQAYNDNSSGFSRRILQVEPERFHTIIPGMVVLNTIAKSFESDSITISKCGIPEGYLYNRVVKARTDV
ncbi:phosphatase [Oscillospiraceae bacterium CM]|nr:phosphatase [Oscillospiraceae bacterium CM]